MTPKEFFLLVDLHGYVAALDNLKMEQIDQIEPHSFKMSLLNAKQGLDGLRNFRTYYVNSESPGGPTQKA